MKKIIVLASMVFVFCHVSMAQEPMKRSTDMGNGVSYEIRGNEGDLVWFSIHGAVIARDNIKDNPICADSHQVSGGTYIVAIVDGRECDLVYGYAIQGNQVIRSPRWRDQTPGALQLNSVTWSGSNTFSIDGRGTMSFSNGKWTCTSGSGAVLQGGQTVINP